MKLLLLLLAISFVTSCATHKSLASSTTRTVSVNNSANDGSSYEKAIVIEEKSEMVGIKAEYAWLREHDPGYAMISQSLDHKDKRSYDIILIKTSDGAEKKVYFDITNFYGRF